MKAVIYTDGSSRKNGKPECTAGWSMVAYVGCEEHHGTINGKPTIRYTGGKTFVRYGHLPAPSSNNQGEIMGVLYGILKFGKSNWDLEFHSDSQYVEKSINEWRHKHRRTHYAGIKNADLLVPLYDAWDTHGRSTIKWVKGHAGHQGNEAADEYAGYGVDNLKRERSDDQQNIQIVDYKEIQCLLKQSMSQTSMA